MSTTPGTVSKILWHFTGGPQWDSQRKKQGTKPKPAKEAFTNLKSILSSQELRLGQYAEIVSALMPVRRFDRVKREMTVVEHRKVTLESSPVCCVSDIPVMHLGYHSARYGKFAIGFHRNAIVKHGFNPVLYSLEDTHVIRAMYEGLSSLDQLNSAEINDLAGELESLTEQLKGGDPAIELEAIVASLRTEGETMEGLQYAALSNLRDLLAFVKTFDQSEFDSVYCEREWRSTKHYPFSIDDVAMIAVPRRVGDREYYRPFCTTARRTLGLPPTIPVVPWEDLVEH